MRPDDRPAQASPSSSEVEGAALARRLEELEAYTRALEARHVSVGRDHALEVQRLREALDREKLSVAAPLARRLFLAAQRITRALPTAVAGPLTEAFFAVWNALFPSSALARRYRADRGLGEPALDRPDLLRRVQSADEGQFDVLVLPSIEWTDRVQRPQHLARELGRLGHRVFYLATRFATHRTPARFRLLAEACERVFLLQLECPAPQPPLFAGPGSSREAKAGILESLAAWRSACGVGQLVLVVHHPFWRDLALSVPGASVVYDVLDDFACFPGAKPGMAAEQRKLGEEADLLIASSQQLAEKISAPACAGIVRNGAQVEHFATRPPALRWTSQRPTVGFFGALQDWVAMHWVAFAAKAHPDWDFVLLGSTRFRTKPLEAPENVILVGEVPYADLPGYLHAFDVCMVPFELDALTVCADPVKVYEYLSAGKPVVATALPELERAREVVHLAETADSFSEKLTLAMEERHDKALAARRQAWAMANSWEVRVQDFERAVRSLAARVSVVVVAWNRLDMTRRCLDSLVRRTHHPNWELIVVDNGSTDGSPEFLKSLKAQHACLRVLTNARNEGYARALNQGLAIATGDYFVLLNNDICVTEGWLADLVRHLKRDATLGLVGPVTNACDNEARIDIHYESMAEMESKALAYTSAHARQQIAGECLSFFCVAMPRSVWSAVGPLDESFQVGAFEDDDYCNRVRAAGWRLAIAEDVFVHHQGSASFDLLTRGERHAIWYKNRRAYEAKWGAWASHRLRQGLAPAPGGRESHED